MNRIEYKALDSKVLAVAVRGGRGDDWTAYIGAVEGNNHEEEAVKVAAEGSKLPCVIAEKLFPDWATEFEWRA